MIGVYSEAGKRGGQSVDIVVMLVFSVLGSFMKKFGYEAAPLVLAFVLGRMAEESIRQSLLMSRGSFEILLTRSLATAFLVLALRITVLPAVLPSARAAFRSMGRETAE